MAVESNAKSSAIVGIVQQVYLCIDHCCLRYSLYLHMQSESILIAVQRFQGEQPP